MDGASSTTPALAELVTQTFVQVEGEDITPEEFHKSSGWLSAGGNGKTSRRRGDQGELADLPGIESSALDNKKDRGKSVRREVIRAARMPSMPAEEIKIVVRPRGGLDIAKSDPARVAEAIMAAAGITEKAERAEDMMCPNFLQNIVVISTPSMARAKKYVQVGEIEVLGKKHEVNAYGTAAHGTVKGVIRGVPVEDSESTLNEQIVTKHNPTAIGAKRIGTSRTVIVAFEGEKVPRFVRYGSMLYQCSLYRKQIEVCRCCGTVGHRGDVCPTPSAKVCLACGVSNPREDHTCVPKCKLCGEGHPTGDRACKSRYKIPYVVRKRRWERRNVEQQQRQQRQRTPSPGSFPRLGSASGVTTHDASRGRRASRDESQHLRSRSRDVSRESIRGNNNGGQKQPQQLRAGVSWAAAAQGNGKTAANGYKNDQDYEQLRRANDQLRATNEKQRATIEMLAKRLAEVERRLGCQQSQPQGQQQWHQGQTRPADTEVAIQAQQKQVQQQRKAEQHQEKVAASQQLPMEVAGDEEEEEASEAPKKKPRKSTKVNLEAQLEKLTATVATLTTMTEQKAGTTEQRFARLEETITAMAGLVQNLNTRFELVEQTLKPIVRSQVFAAQFVNHPYLQDQVQQSAEQQPCQDGPIAQ